jgi:hypothetical protein
MGAVEPEPSGGGEVLEAARAGEKEEALGRERERKSSLWLRLSRGGAAIAAAALLVLGAEGEGGGSYCFSSLIQSTPRFTHVVTASSSQVFQTAGLGLPCSM